MEKNYKIKRILYISSNDPDYFNGGALGTQKIIKVLEDLRNKKQIEWFGVISKGKNSTKEKKYYLEFKRSKIKAYISRVLGYAEQLELYKWKIIKEIENLKIDTVILQSSRLGNISEKIKQKFPNIKIIQHFDNFEYEFSKMFVQNRNFFIRKIECYNTKKTEKKAIKNMNYGLFLTENDKTRIEDFYSIKINNFDYIPFIYFNIFSEEKIFKKKKQIIFTGSLDMEANIEASLFLLENYKKFFMKKNLKLILAGRNPNPILEKTRKKLNLNNIEIVKNPTKEEMEKFLRESLMYISPVFRGSGMKTKVAEALFYGLPILASKHSAIGYNNLNLEYIKVFDEGSPEEFLVKFEELYKKKLDNQKLEGEIRRFFYKEFLDNKIIKKIEERLKSV